MEYSRPPISIDEQVKKLSDRGLIINTPHKAKETLSNISYYRLRAYTYPFQDNNNPNHPFIFSVSFDDIIALYEFDHKLRLLVFDALEKIEIALRTKIIYYMSMSCKGSWFENSSLFRNHFRFVKDSEKLNKEIHRSQETFIKHYKTKYSNPANPPAWMSLEVTSMGLLSKFFENIKMCPEKKIIVKEFGLKILKFLKAGCTHSLTLEIFVLIMEGFGTEDLLPCLQCQGILFMLLLKKQVKKRIKFIM